MKLRIEGPQTPSGQLPGWKYFWARYVRGFDPSVHCQPCLLGSTSRALNRVRYQVGSEVAMDEARRWDYLYVCGVSEGYVYDRNFHLVLRPTPGELVTATTYNGSTVIVEDAAALPIPELPAGWGGWPPRFTTCRNWRMGVAYYGIAGEGYEGSSSGH